MQPVVKGKERALLLKQMMRSGTCGLPSMEVVAWFPTAAASYLHHRSFIGERRLQFGGYGRSFPAADSYAESSGLDATRDAAPSC